MFETCDWHESWNKVKDVETLHSLSQLLITSQSVYPCGSGLMEELSLVGLLPSW